MIFCVEDDSNIRELVVYTLESTGFQARGFEDGSSFLEALALETPELVLLDIMLPGEDGMELLRKLKANAFLLGIAMKRPFSPSITLISCTTNSSSMVIETTALSLPSFATFRTLTSVICMFF